MTSLTEIMPPIATSSITSKTKHMAKVQNDNENSKIDKNNIKANNTKTKTTTTFAKNATKMQEIGPITDITENTSINAIKSSKFHDTSTSTTRTLKSTKIEHESQCSISMSMRVNKSKQSLEQIENMNSSEDCLLHVPQKNLKGTHELLTIVGVSRSKEVIQDQLEEFKAREPLKREFQFHKTNKLNNKTETNEKINNSMDAEASVNNLESEDYIKDAHVGVVEKSCDGNEVIVKACNEVEDCPVKLEKPLSRSNKENLTTETTTNHAVRPSTLATSNGFPIATPTSPILKSTPKTPNSTPLHNEKSEINTIVQSHQHCINRKHQHQHHLPAEVSKTTAITTSTKLTPKTPPVTPDSPATYLDDDIDSIYSFATTTTSGRSTMSCEHSYVAHNGTTFSGRKNKFVIHNSQHAGLVGSAYVTPTQRAQIQIRKLKALLHAMQQDLNQKNDEILKLTREVAELRLFKASVSSPEERSASSDAVTVREAELQTSQDVSPIVDMIDDATKSSPRHITNSNLTHSYQNYLQQQQSVMNLSTEMQSSFADSGHFEDMTSMSMHSKDTHDGSDEDNGARGNDAENAVAAAEREVEVQRQELIRMYEQRIEELIRNQDVASNEMKRIHNDKVEALLQKLSECNTRYADVVPDYEMAKERIRELEGQLEDLQRKLFENEAKQNKMYLHMYQKGQESERIARADQALELAHRAPNNHVSINELLHQLQSTQEELENIREAEYKRECGSNHALLTAKEAISLWVLGARKTIYRRLLEAQKNRTHVDPEVTLQFLKSAVYYFLTDKENSQGHLQAIESILEFTEAEKQNIEKARIAK